MPAVVWTAAVVTDGSAEGYDSRERGGTYCLPCVFTGSVGEVTIKGLKPETKYEVKVSAVNGKGEGESSPAHFFSTEPVSKWHRFHPRQHTRRASAGLLTLSLSERYLESRLGGEKSCWSHLLIGGEREREKKTFAKKRLCTLPGSCTQVCSDAAETASQWLPRHFTLGLSLLICQGVRLTTATNTALLFPIFLKSNCAEGSLKTKNSNRFSFHFWFRLLITHLPMWRII